MAQKQVGARTEGDVFQGMFFWLQAAQLLRSSSNVIKVAIEVDHAAGVDDVGVWYREPGILDAGRNCVADYYQIKYHVDRSRNYDSETLCDPKFIKATQSLLQRFYDAHSRLQQQCSGWYRLHLVSNWQWSPTDPLGPVLRESSGGALPDKFFAATPNSRLGKIRDKWRTHLGLNSADFEDFARRLRIDVNYLSRNQFRELLNERLENVGLKGIRPDQVQCIYDSLVQHFVMDGNNEFDETAFREFCSREELFASPRRVDGPPVIGIRSISRFAERMEDECQQFVCVAEHFDGRHVREQALWQGAILETTKAFLNDQSYRKQEHHLLLDCHTSLALLAGYELDLKSGAQVYPVQKGVSTATWKPTGAPISVPAEWLSNPATSPVGKGSDVAIAISVRHDIVDDVRLYVESSSDIGTLVDARPLTGVGPSSVQGADHAKALADSLADLIRRYRPKGGGMVHLFISAPNALTFFLGQHRAALGRVQLYEFDFEGERGGTYSPTIRLPA
ncbi:hypothetical protein D3C72_61610 [compost metagenome]